MDATFRERAAGRTGQLETSGKVFVIMFCQADAAYLSE